MPRGRPAGSCARAQWRRGALTGCEARSCEPDPGGSEAAGPAAAAAGRLPGAGECAGRGRRAGCVCGAEPARAPRWARGAAAEGRCTSRPPLAGATPDLGPGGAVSAGRCSDPRAPASLLVPAGRGGLRRRDPSASPHGPPGLAGRGAGAPAESRAGGVRGPEPTASVPPAAGREHLYRSCTECGAGAGGCLFLISIF